MDYLEHISNIIKSELDVDIILEKSRKREIVDAKRIYSDIARELTMYSFQDIGGFISVNHATVIHYCNSSKDLRESNRCYLKNMTKFT